MGGLSGRKKRVRPDGSPEVASRPRFGISPFRVDPEDLVELTEQDYQQLSDAKDALGTMLGVEQKFDLLIENYADYERQLLDISLRETLRRPDSDGRVVRGS